MKSKTLVLIALLLFLQTAVLAKKQDPLALELEQLLSSKLDIDLSNWIYGQYPNLIFSVDSTGAVERLEVLKGLRNYNARICKAVITDLAPLAPRFANHDFKLSCKPEFELSKKIQKNNHEYQQDYAREIGEQIFFRANKKDFEELDAELLALKLKLDASGKLVMLAMVKSSGFEEIDQTFEKAAKDIAVFAKPDLERFRIKTGKLASTVDVDIYFLLGKKYKGIDPAKAVATGATLGSIGLTTASIVRNIMLLAR